MKYLAEHDLSMISEDAIFTMMGSGEEARGRKSIDNLLDFYYNKAFSASNKERNLIISNGTVVLETDFFGKQNLLFAGILPAKSGREVHIPMCVVYNVKDQKIYSARIYFETDALRMLGGL